MLRFVIVAAHLISAVAIVGSALLLPSYLELKLDKTKNEEEKGKKIEPEITIEELRSYKKTTDKKISYINNLTNLGRVDEMEALLRGRGDDVRITSIDVEVSKEQKPVIQISGVANTRSALSSWVETLRGESLFSSVDAPLSLFTKDRDIIFNISVVGGGEATTTNSTNP